MDQHHPIGDSFSIRRSIAHGFLAIRIAAAPLWLAGVLMAITDGCGFKAPPFDVGDFMPEPDRHSAVHWLPGMGRGAWPWPTTAAPWEQGLSDLSFLVPLLGAIAAAIALFFLALIALNAFLHTGFIRLHVNILTHASDSFAPMFSGKDRFWHMLGFKLLAVLAVSASAIATAWPGGLILFFAPSDDIMMNLAGIGLILLLTPLAMAYVTLGVYLGALAVALEGAGPVEALRRSWDLARGNRLQLFVFALLCWLIEFASLFGVILFCVGLLITVPFARSLTGFAKTEGYLLFTRGMAQTAGWKLWQRDLLEQRQQQAGQRWNVPGGPAPAPPPAGPAEPQAQQAPEPQQYPPLPSALPWEPLAPAGPPAPPEPPPQPPAASDDQPPADWPPRPPKK